MGARHVSARHVTAGRPQLRRASRGSNNDTRSERRRRCCHRPPHDSHFDPCGVRVGFVNSFSFSCASRPRLFIEDPLHVVAPEHPARLAAEPRQGPPVMRRGSLRVSIGRPMFRDPASARHREHPLQPSMRTQPSRLGRADQGRREGLLAIVQQADVDEGRARRHGGRGSIVGRPAGMRVIPAAARWGA